MTHHRLEDKMAYLGSKTGEFTFRYGTRLAVATAKFTVNKVIPAIGNLSRKTFRTVRQAYNNADKVLVSDKLAGYAQIIGGTAIAASGSYYALYGISNHEFSQGGIEFIIGTGAVAGGGYLVRRGLDCLRSANNSSI